MLYILNKQLPWKEPTEQHLRQHVDGLGIKKEAEKRWAYSRAWLITYVLQANPTMSDALMDLFDVLACHAHLRPTQLDPVIHLLPLGIQTSTSTETSTARVYYPSFCPLEWALHFQDVEGVRFLISRGAPLEHFYFAALANRHAPLSLYVARQYELPSDLHLPSSLFLSAEGLRTLAVHGIEWKQANASMHCADLATFHWAEKNVWSDHPFSQDDVQRMLITYWTYGIFDIPAHLFGLPAFATLFPLNKGLRILLSKTSPDAVAIMKRLYDRRPAPIFFDNGMTALQFAAQTGNRVMVTALLECGDHAWRNYTNGIPLLSTSAWFGKNAATYAREAQHHALGLLIEQWGTEEGKS